MITEVSADFPSTDFALFNNAAENNKQPILQELTRLLSRGSSVLEIGGGSGQHVYHFAKALPDITWQSTAREPYFSALKENLAKVSFPNIPNPRYLNIAQFPDDLDCTSAYCANVVHIMPESLIAPLFRGIRSNVRLQEGGCFILYGPYKYDGQLTTESNRNFDRWLKDRDPLSGIRDIELLMRAAEENDMALVEDVAMPANNQLLVFRAVSPG